jgi:hypothetical protein
MFTIRAARDSLADMPGIETARLSIAALRPEDAQDLRRLTDDPAITAAVDFLPAPFTLQDAEDLIRSGARGQDRFLGAWSRVADGEPASVRALVGVVGTHLRGAGVIEIGYWIGGAARGLGDHRGAERALPGALPRGRVPARQRRLVESAREARLPRHRRGRAPAGPTPAPTGLTSARRAQTATGTGWAIVAATNAATRRWRLVRRGATETGPSSTDARSARAKPWRVSTARVSCDCDSISAWKAARTISFLEASGYCARTAARSALGVIPGAARLRSAAESASIEAM